MPEKLTSFGPMGPSGIARTLTRARGQIRSAIENSAAERYDAYIEVESHIKGAIQSLAAALCPFGGGSVPPGFIGLQAARHSGAIAEDKARLGVALAAKDPGIRLVHLWLAYDSLLLTDDYLRLVEMEALDRHNAKIEPEGGAS